MTLCYHSVMACTSDAKPDWRLVLHPSFSAAAKDNFFEPRDDPVYTIQSDPHPHPGTQLQQRSTPGGTTCRWAGGAGSAAKLFTCSYDGSVRALDPAAGAFQLVHTDEDAGAAHVDSVIISHTSWPEIMLTWYSQFSHMPIGMGGDAPPRSTAQYPSWTLCAAPQNVLRCAECSAFDCAADGNTCFCGDKDGDLRVLDLRVKDGQAGPVRPALPVAPPPAVAECYSETDSELPSVYCADGRKLRVEVWFKAHAKEVVLQWFFASSTPQVSSLRQPCCIFHRGHCAN